MYDLINLFMNLLFYSLLIDRYSRKLIDLLADQFTD